MLTQSFAVQTTETSNYSYYFDTIRTYYLGPAPEVSFFFLAAVAGLTNRVPVRDSRAGAPLLQGMRRIALSLSHQQERLQRCCQWVGPRTILRLESMTRVALLEDGEMKTLKRNM